MIGLIVPSTSPLLFEALKAKTGAAASPFVVGVYLNEITRSGWSDLDYSCYPIRNQCT